MHHRVLITGGAGFIGSHLADALLARGARVRVMDSLVPQVHGPDRRRPPYLSNDVELIVGDVRDRDAVTRAMSDVDAVVHLAASVGVGQSMYAIADYTSVNSVGTGVLLEVAVARRLRRLVVASSMSIYGEGLYTDGRGRRVAGVTRGLEQLREGQWELRDAEGARLTPVATPEDKAPSLESIYALTKYDQERMCLLVGRAYGIEAVALRLFNTYGPRQALSNPYTGVLAIFASRLLNDARPLVFEDGEQRRDFVSVHDVARAFVLALEAEGAVGHALNVASGASRTIREVAEHVAVAVGRPSLVPELTGTHRVGDVRHCFADITAARDLLGYRPEVGFDEGLRELAEWLRGQTALDRVAQARAELESRGLTL
jgi:dTDP-L-rhamnose 4-epimerase